MMEVETDVVVTNRRRRSRRESLAVAEAAAEAEFELAESETETREVSDRRRQDRRRQIDPTTCERDYSGCEVEFMRAMDDYKRKSGRPFPTWSEVLEVLMSLGYRKVADPSQMEWRTNGERTEF
jgi:hypothetical protein